MDSNIQTSSFSEDKQHTILVVDDNPINLGVVFDYLEGGGFRLLVSRNGKTALDIAQNAQPNLILLDVMMPDMDGFETCRRLKSNPQTKHISVIFMTALADTKHRVVGFEAGGVDYITKPIQQEEMLARISIHLRLQELTESLETIVKDRTNELNQAYHNLERLDRAKNDFIQVISHELRTPLTVIDGYTQLLKSDSIVQTHPHLMAMTDNILQGTMRMLHTINHILDATKINQASLNVFKEKLIIYEVIKKIRREFKDILIEREITLTIKNVAELPPIKADPKLLFRAFYHIVNNAIKYTPNQGHIDIEGQYLPDIQPEPVIEIVVRDTGIGIDSEHLSLIFEKFYQTGKVALHSSSKTNFKGGGPGLGLAIAKGIITAHGGKIWAESKGHSEMENLGSQFYVHLPLA